MAVMRIDQLTFAYPEARENALSDISMTFEDGSFNVICGRSGCGKSTLLRQLKPALAPFGRKKGQIFFNGSDIYEMSQRDQAQKIGFVLQNPEEQVVTDKVWHELAFGLESLGLDQQTIRLRVAEMSSYFGIQEWVHRDVADLSGGQKQLLSLASIMAMHPEILILDEPTSQLDPIAASDFLETIRKINRDLGTTIILTEHRLQDVIPYADQVYVLEAGRMVCSGTPSQIGRQLGSMHHGMFLSMPVPMQIYAEVGENNSLHCPLTISQGRRWLNEMVRGHELQTDKPEVEASEAEKADITVNNEFRENQSLNSDKQVPIIEMKDVWFRYDREGRDVVHDLNLTVYEGEFFTLVGGNGTGKSTTLSLLSRINVPYRGKIRISGKDLKSYKDNELYRGMIGVLPQNPQSMFLKNTVEDDLYSVIGGRSDRKNALYSASMNKKEAVDGMAKLCMLDHLMDRHPYDLSGGEQQRLALAKVLLLRPKILMMDEPTKGMDGEFKENFGRLLKKLQSHGITIFMISHDIEFVAEYADRTGFFFDGSVTTAQDTRQFFAGNSFYTTAANRMARHLMPWAVTGKDVISCLKKIQ